MLVLFYVIICTDRKAERGELVEENKYKVKLDGFEGPLDLLLHLVNKMEIDLYDIPVAEITEQYMAYIQAMKEIELNIASEYLVMAATLLAMKSSTLLPTQENVDDEDDYEEDPKEALITRLIEYRKYKEAAEQLKEKELEENQIYTRAPYTFDESFEKPPITKGEASIFSMIDAMQAIIERQKYNQPLQTRIDKVELTIDERMDEIINLVEESSDVISFEELFPYADRSHIVTSFLAILQLLKDKKIYCQQAHNFAPIFVEKYKLTVS